MKIVFMYSRWSKAVGGKIWTMGLQGAKPRRQEGKYFLFFYS